MKLFLKDQDATYDLGEEIAGLISDSSNDIIEIHFVGELGAGKTFLLSLIHI